MRIVRKEPGKEPEYIYVTNGPTELHALQTLVGGRIEHITLGNIVMLFDEEGKFKNKRFNFPLPNGDYIAGTCLFVGRDGSEFTHCPMTPKQVTGMIEDFTL